MGWCTFKYSMLYFIFILTLYPSSSSPHLNFWFLYLREGSRVKVIIAFDEVKNHNCLLTSLQVSPRSISPWPASCPEPLPPLQAYRAVHTWVEEWPQATVYKIVITLPLNELFGWHLMDTDPFQSILHLGLHIEHIQWQCHGLDLWARAQRITKRWCYPLPGEIKGVGIVVLNPHLPGC